MRQEGKAKAEKSVPEKTGRHVRRSIGGLLKAKRLAQGLTLQELAQRSELSAAFLSQAERGKATPSIVSLINIARALDTDIHYFISPPAAATLVSRADEPRYLELDSPVQYRVMNADIPNQRLGALLMTVPPGIELPAVHRDEGEDLFFILSGNIELEIDGKHFTLGAGDSTHINTQLDHSMRNSGSEDATLLWVGTPALLPPERSDER